jgi:hypothetical protein
MTTGGRCVERRNRWRAEERQRPSYLTAARRCLNGFGAGANRFGTAWACCRIAPS